MAISNTATKAKASEKEVFTVHERMQFISHQGKQVALADLSNCSAVEVEQSVRAIPDYVTARPLGSVLLLVDFTGASFDQDALRAMKRMRGLRQALHQEGDMGKRREPSARIREGPKSLLSA